LDRFGMGEMQLAVAMKNKMGQADVTKTYARCCLDDGA
jgi:hypothetical protein